MRPRQSVVFSTCGPCNSCLNSFCFSTSVSLLLTFACFGLFVENLVLTHFLPQNLAADAQVERRVLAAPAVGVERGKHAAALGHVPFAAVNQHFGGALGERHAGSASAVASGQPGRRGQS